MEIWSILVALICFLGVGSFYLLFQHQSYRRPSRKVDQAIALTYKGIATLFAAGLAFYGVTQSPSLGNIFLMLGLFVCAIADVVLGVAFIKGMAIFGLGHILYCVAYLLKAPPSLVSLLIFLLLLCICFFVYPQIKKRADGQTRYYVEEGLPLLVMSRGKYSKFKQLWLEGKPSNT